MSTLNPKLKSTGAGRYQLLSRWWDAHRKQRLPERLLSEKSDAVALQQIKERGALPMIDRGYPSGNRPLQQYLGFTAGRWLWSSEHKADSLIAKFKEAGGTVREIDEQSHRDYLRSGYLHHRSARHGLLIITVITPLPTKPSATKMPEN